MREAMSSGDFVPTRLLVAGGSVLVLVLGLVLVWWIWKVVLSRRSSISRDASCEQLLAGADDQGGGETFGPPRQTSPVDITTRQTSQNPSAIDISGTTQVTGRCLLRNVPSRTEDKEMQEDTPKACHNEEVPQICSTILNSRNCRESMCLVALTTFSSGYVLGYGVIICSKREKTS